jgi:hypothetical protein
MALYKLVSEKVTVTTAGVAVPLSATSKLVASLAILASNNNVARVYVGDNSVSSSDGMDLKPEGAMDIELQNDANGKMMELDLADIYIDADTDGNEVRITYLARA